MGKGFIPDRLKSFFTWQKLGIRIGAIILAGLLWLFVVSENEYTMVVDMPIEARNLPARHALKEEVPEFAKVRLKGTGRSLFKTFILKRFIPGYKLVLDLERISEEYDFILNDYFERYPQKVAIPSNFEVTYIEVIYPSSIHISLDEYKEKTVLVVPKIQITTAPGFAIVGKPIIYPTKVKIAGSRNIVETISYIETISDTVINVNSPISIDLSSDPLSATITSPSRPELLIPAFAFSIQYKIVFSSFKQGRTTEILKLFIYLLYFNSEFHLMY